MADRHELAGDARRADEDFRTYRDHGSAEALARVFDRLAPRLLLVAGHLTRDAAEAEDLVQTTFLEAMRSAQDHDGRRPVLTWMSGILANRARDRWRRDGVRRAERLLEREDPGAADPLERAALDELVERVNAAVDDLDAPYREVLALRLVHGLEPTAIAHALGRAPGTVRMQLARGLERLRRALPRPAALLGALAVDLDPGSGLRAVRASVLSQAGATAAPARTAPPSPPSSSGALAPSPLALTSLGGLLTMKTLAAVTALALLTVLLLRALPDGSPGEPSAAVASAAVAGPAELRAPEPAPSRAPAAAEPPVSAPASRASHAPAAVDDGLALAVRYERDGAPAAGVGVYLRQLGQGAPALGTEVRTDRAGRARFDALVAGPCELVVDRVAGSTRIELPHPEELRITIPAGLDVSGVVVDLAGEPVPGAAVLALRAEHHDRLLHVARADGAGRFTLREVEPRTRLVARAPGHQPSEPQTPRADRELELRLGARGHLLRGRVVDAEGAPVPHAWVGVAVDEDAREAPEGSRARPEDAELKALDLEIVLLRADVEGRFESDEVPAGHLTVIARPPERPAGPAEVSVDGAAGVQLVGWARTWMELGGKAEVTVGLLPGASVVGAVRDSSGRPLEGLALEAEWEGTPGLGQLEDELGPFLTDRRTRSGADGAFELGGLLPGEYDLRVVGAHRDLARDERHLAAGARVGWNPVVSAVATLRVRLVDPEGAPLEGWSVETSDRPGDTSPARRGRGGRTDAAGRCALQGLEPDRGYRLAAFPPAADDPAPAAVWHDLVPSDLELELRLAPEELPTAGLRGRWTDARGEPLASATLLLVRDDRRGGLVLVTDGGGRFRRDELVPGDYALRSRTGLYPRDANLVRVTLAADEVADVGTVSLPDAVTVEVRLEGAPPGLERPELVLRPLGEDSAAPEVRDWLPSGPAGLSGESSWKAEVLPGAYRLVVGGRRQASDTRELTVAAAPVDLSIRWREGHRVQLSIEGGAELSADLELRVLDERERVVFELEGRGLYRSGRGARLTVALARGAYRAVASHPARPGHAAEARFEVTGAEDQRVELTLE